MLPFIYEILEFLLKSVIIVTSIVIVLSFLVSLAMKQKMNDSKFKFTDLGKKLKKDSDSLKQKMLSKKEAKVLLKEKKKEEKKEQKSATETKKPKLFVLDFEGDIKASSVGSLRKCITQVISIADKEKDEVLLRIESPGGQVSGYGLAASELDRLKSSGIKLNVSVDKVAASGGYLMACVADNILAAPFAIVGSIGVVAGMPNFHKLLKKYDIDYEVLTAGKFKRTLTVLGENTEEGKEKFLDQLEQIHALFKDFVNKHRPSLNMDEVGTGEYWFGNDALKKNLVDTIQTSEDFILSKVNSHLIFELEYKEKQKLSEKLAEVAQAHLFKEPGIF